jgi:hypothetical protein
MLSVVTLFAIFVLVKYIINYYDVKKLYNLKPKLYNKEYLQQLVVKAVQVLKKYANTVAHPYFYNQSINIILTTCPEIVHVLKLCKYVLEFSESKTDLNNILLELYGNGFEDSTQLNVLVKVQTSEYGIREYFHYVLEDIEKCTYLYIRNKAYLDNNFIIR